MDTQNSVSEREIKLRSLSKDELVALLLAESKEKEAVERRFEKVLAQAAGSSNTDQGKSKEERHGIRSRIRNSEPMSRDNPNVKTGPKPNMLALDRTTKTIQLDLHEVPDKVQEYLLKGSEPGDTSDLQQRALI
ncbi:hypothetical protein TrVE_jg11957, partial [Triparma verrucosa]